MTTPFSPLITVTDNITGEKATRSATFNVNNAVGPPTSGQCLFGVYDPANDADGFQGWGGGDGGIQQFETGANLVRIGTDYIQWQGSFFSNFSNLCQQHGAIPFLELEPWFTQNTFPPFANIAAGAYDSYLQSFGSSIASFGHTVWLTYAHEMNGSWYPWGNGGVQGVTPTQWVASWKHVHDTINSTAGGLVKWVWAPNNADVGSVVPYWPGDSFVDIVAYDGYIQNNSQTFGNFQQQTVNQIRTVTSKPIWNSECGLNPVDGNQPTAIRNFIKAMHDAGLSGFMWWNQSPFNVTGASLNAVTQAVADWNAGTL